jgi:hypothetical protein
LNAGIFICGLDSKMTYIKFRIMAGNIAPFLDRLSIPIVFVFITAGLGIIYMLISAIQSYKRRSRLEMYRFDNNGMGAVRGTDFVDSDRDNVGSDLSNCGDLGGDGSYGS